MTIKLINRGTTGELMLDGRLDTITSPEAEAVFMESAGRFDRIILNMTDLEYVSSAGLRVLKRLHITMQKKGGELVLRNVNKLVTEVLEMTGFIGLLKLE